MPTNQRPRMTYDQCIKEELKDFVGATIVEVGASESDDLWPDGCPFITILTKKGKFKTVAFFRDEEGNGSGHPHVQDGKVK